MRIPDTPNNPMQSNFKSNRSPDSKTSLETMSLIVVAVLLILTSIGNATVMFGASVLALFGLFVWYLADRNVWLATVSGMTFAVTVLVIASKLY